MKTHKTTKFLLPGFFLKTVISALILISLSYSTNAQVDNLFHSNAALAEKVYLQLDGKAYTAGHIVWFKAIIANACEHKPSPLSGVLYVDLISSDETVIEKKLIKINKGIGEGFFYLDKHLKQGRYLIRAYTLWNMNFGSDFMFKEYIQVFTPTQIAGKPITNIKLIKDETNVDHLKACFNPQVIDSMHRNKLNVLVAIDDKKDTLRLKKGKDKQYHINYKVPNDSQFATLQMITANEERYATTVVLNNEQVDLQFFPESGEFVHGLDSKVGFKALDSSGKGKIVQGVIVDENDSVIKSFHSNRLGMGSFKLEKLDTLKNYFARLLSTSDDKLSFLYPLPKVASEGNSLSVEKQSSDTLLLTAMSNYMSNDSIYLSLSFRGARVYDMRVPLNEGCFKVYVPTEKLPEGIMAFTMKGRNGRPLAERLYFNEKLTSRLNIDVTTDKKIYGKREITKVAIETKNSKNQPAIANLSLLAINKKQMGEMQSTRQNILSYFLLNSELKGQVEDPGYYFGSEECRHADLDALMLTQGWRKYHYAKPFKMLPYKAEQFLTVSGQVSSVFSKKKKKVAELTMMTFGKDKSIYSQITDTLGRFRFRLNDQYGKNVNILIQSAKKTGKKMNYTVELDKPEFPSINFNHQKSIQQLDSVVFDFAEKDLVRRKIEDAFPLSSDNIMIEEVVVQGYNMTPNRKKVMEEYGEPDEVIDGKEILAKEEKWSYGLYSVLLFNYPEKVRIERDREGFLVAKIMGSDLTLVVVDGVPVKAYEYSLIPNIPPSEVSSFEVIKCAKNFTSLFMDVYNTIPPPGIMCGGIIAIYTHGKKGIYGANQPVGIMQTSVPIFSATREFYAPKYENIKPEDWYKPDLRALVHWQPVMKTDSLGKAASSFYNSDNIGDVMVVIEAISENGEIGYKEVEYEVEGVEKELIIAF
ncbi:hypothetical protein EYV94_02105 [Puteibacter caeruleilacunae]|nr:hypothetical protein EYV94_02105 [Puteibacter caeruleilacunae]